MNKKIVICLLLLLSVSILFTGCKLFTVVKITKSSTVGNQFNTNNFDANAYVKKVWNSQAMPELQKKAIDLGQLLNDANGNLDSVGKEYGITTDSLNSYNFIVKGTLTVNKVDTQLRAGTLECTLPGYSGKTAILLQIGPMYTSSSLRDSLSFVKFEDFQNQVVFDSVSDAFNAYIYNNVVSKVDVNNLQGKTVTFLGTFTANDPSTVSITPAELNAE